MKALVLAGGFPQIDLIIKLRQRGIYTILAECPDSYINQDIGYDEYKFIYIYMKREDA